MLENMVFGIIFTFKRKKEDGDWGNLYTKQLHNLYPSSNITTIIKSMTMKWGGHVAYIRTMRNTYRVFFGKREGKRTLRRPRYSPIWECNITTDLEK
jgi:hypothetical protein